MMKKTTTIVLLVMLLLTLTGCADMLNTALGYENAYRKPVDGFEVYKLNTNYVMLVWNENRTDGEYYANGTIVNRKRSDYNQAIFYYCYEDRPNDKWYVDYYSNEEQKSPEYSTEEKSALPLHTSLVYDSSSNMFLWSALPESLVAHIDGPNEGLYIVRSTSVYLTSIPTDSSYRVENVASTQHVPTSAVGNGTYSLYVKVTDSYYGTRYYNIGQFTKQ